MKNVSRASLIVAVKTPYLENGKIDLKSYEKILRRLVKYNVDGVVVGGTTGEGHLLSWEEHIMLIAFTVNNFKNDLCIIGNTGSNNTREAVKATDMGFAVGMDASLQINPYYGKTSPNGLAEHFGRTLDIGPVMIYNVSSRTAQDITPETILPLSKHPNFIGVKECSGNERIKFYTEKNIVCWSGNDDQCFAAKHTAGAVGVVSVAGNFLPQIFRTLMDDKHAENLNRAVIPFLDALYRQPNPIGLNTLMAMSGLAKPVFRLPYFPLSLEDRKKIMTVLDTLKPHELPATINVMSDDEFILI